MNGKLVEMNGKKINSKSAFSLIEILIVVAIVGILAMVGFVSSSNIKVKQEEHAAVEMLRQSVAFAASSSGAKGERLRLVFDDSANTLLLKDANNAVLEQYKFPNSVTTDLDNGDMLEFTPLGWVDSASLSGSDGFPNPIQLSTADKTYNITISLIAEVKAEVN